MTTFYCEDQIKLAHSIVNKYPHSPVWHFDATGSIIKESGKRILLYSLCAHVNLPNIKCLALLEFLSDAHDAATIKSILLQWIDQCGKLIRHPKVIVSDQSWAILNACAKAFNNKSILEQISAQWQCLLGNPAELVILRLCANHYISLVCRKISHLKVTPKVNVIFFVKVF